MCVNPGTLTSVWSLCSPSRHKEKARPRSSNQELLSLEVSTAPQYNQLHTQFYTNRSMSVGAAGGFRVRHQDGSLGTPLGGATCAAPKLHQSSIIARLSKPALPVTHHRFVQSPTVVTRPRLALLFPLFPCAQVFASSPSEVTTCCSLPPALVPPPSSAPMKEIIMQSLHLPVLLPAPTLLAPQGTITPLALLLFWTVP